MKLSQRQIDKMTEYGIPSHMHGGIIRYYENGIEPGGFLCAVINNDLHGALGQADDTNINCLKAYGMWFYNQAPIGSYGQPDSVKKWCNPDRLECERKEDEAQWMDPIGTIHDADDDPAKAYE